MFDDEFEDFEDEFGGHNPFKAQKSLYTLPELTNMQQFLCDQCGSGNPVKPLHYKNVYQRILNMQTGEGMEKFEMIYVSPCCKGDLSIWDDVLEDYVEIDPKHYESLGEQNP
ncbi:hypothetical protein KMZ14_05080 [Acinetobacter schindleri]|uniref:hypothetical protein n=1 Tax=Acinetobacter schindleri TaxID=108981 RepID=UPI002360E310|nr:hypothetical protein [Acinetobacter schindleri]WDE16921.1 hypothetical protein KMZ14_05080 [Acinetobacter schindleri]